MSRRHKPEPNLLADWLDHQLKALEPYKSVIAVGAAVVAVLALLAAFLYTGDNPALAQEWSAYLSSLTQEDPKASLENLTKAGSNSSPAILHAKQTLADHTAARGSQLMFLNRSEAVETLTKAAKLYKEVAAQATSQPQLQNRARIGEARVSESLAKPDEAKRLLEAVVQSDKDSVIGKTAQDGLKRLENQRVIATLAWFADQKPKPPKTAPHGGMGPRFEDGVTDRPDPLTPGFKPLGTIPEDAEIAPPAAPNKTAPAIPDDNPAPEGSPEKAPEKTSEKPATEEKAGDKSPEKAADSPAAEDK